MGNSNIPLFSIIIPVYNVSNYIEVTVGSILSQTYSNFELLLIDDGSIDGSSELLDKMEQNDKRIRVFHQPNSGVSAARNLGLENAVGEWIVFVDGDDAIRNDALYVLSRCIKRHPSVDLIGYGFEKVENISLGNINENIANNCYDNDCCCKETVNDCSRRVCFGALNHYMVWTEAFRRDILGDLRFEPLKNGEDVLFCNSLALKANCYVALDARLYLYLQREGSAQSNKWSEQRQDDYMSLHNGIMENISLCKKELDLSWIKRWIGNLLQYTPKIPKVDNTTRKNFFSQHYSLLKQIKNLPTVPNSLKIWISIATLLNSETYFKLTAILPMKLYSKLISR